MMLIPQGYDYLKTASTAAGSEKMIGANAVYHATGKRVRDLPIRLDKLL